MRSRRSREEFKEERARAILEAARRRADAEGWQAVTTRRLSEDIGYTQPVLYGHFPGGKSEIMLAVALAGFADLARACRDASSGRHGREALAAVADAYLDFASDHPAVYEAMFTQPIDAPFASPQTPADMRAGFDALAEALGDEGDGTRTEVVWGALHGLSQLARAGRLRPEHREARVAALVVMARPT